MEKEKEKEKEKEAKKKVELVKVKPLKDFVIHTHEFHYDLKKGEELEVNKIFLQNLKTEKVIK